MIFEAGKTILMKDKPMAYAMVVISGTVKETYSNFKITRGVGNLLSAYSIVIGNECRCVLRAQSNCKILAFRMEVFRETMATNSIFQGRVYKSAFICAVKTDEHNKLNFLPEKKLRTIA
jgi:signal-transduction protein with cAMP-binding, CBS, and nucleotidyltransferase domain